MSDDTSDTNTTKSTRSNTKVYPHVLPRVDPEYYQAEIPNAYSGPAPTEAVKVSWFESTREVHSTNKSEEAKRQFLTFARNVFDRAHHSNLVWGKDLSTFPLHSDEHALEFLALHNYEINRAKFFLCSFLGGGREAIHMTRVRQQLAKLPTGVHVNEKLELMFKELNTSIIFGVLSSSPSSERTYVMETTGPHRLQQIDSESNARSKSSRSSRKGGCSSGTEHHSPLGNKDRYRGKADKQEMKKKWLGILRTSNTLISGIKSEYGGYSRPSLESLQDLFRLIFTALPIPSDILLGEEHYATLQTNLHELIDKYIHCKEWAADVYDAFCPNSSCATDFKHLKKMLNEGERLPFRCVVEENQLKRTIKDLENLATEGRRILDICSNKKILTESEKVSLFDLNELLKVTSPFKAIDNIPNMPQASINSLRNLYRRSIELNETIENALHRAALPRSKRSRVNKLNLTEAVELHNETSSFPVVLYGVPHLKNIVKAGMVWNTEMRQVCADGAPLVSLNKLEALISSGEKLPVDFTEELDALRDKRSQAKQWLEKFRKSVAVTSRASRHGDGGSGPQGSGGKMGLSDMKKMVEQGEQLYEERKNKDLTRAVDLVDAAEEWIARVMESMEAGENVDIDELQDLLDETEGMPVAMEEAGLLRCHIEALKWAAKAKPALEKKSSKLSTLQKLQREITRIRESLSEDMRKRMTNRLPEETKLAEILCDVQNWQQQMKRKFQDGKVSASLEVLKDLLAKAEELPLDLDTETKSLRLAVTEATDWIHSHMDTLVSLGIPIASVDINLPRDICASFTEGEDMEIPTDESFNPNILGTPTRDMVHDTPVGSPHLNSSPNLVGYPDIKLLIESAKHISITFPELTSARERFDDVISWLDMVELKCPKRSGKKPQHTADFDFRHGEFSCVQTSELEELLEEANKLRVVFPDEIQRINDVISRAYEWEKNTQDKLTSVFEGMHDMMLKSRGYVVSPKYSEFPFMKGAEVDSNEIFDFFEISTEQKGTMLKVESRKYDSTTTTTTTPPWEDLEQTFVPALNALIREGEEAGAMTSKSMVLAVCMNVLQWVSIVKGKLMNLNWGDCTRSDIMVHVEDARQIVPIARSKEFDKYYVGTLLATSEMPDIDDLPDTMHDAEESSDRRPRNRDTIDWASRLSAAGQIDTSMEASSSPRSKASGVSPSSSRTSKRKRTSASRNDLGADMETTGGKSSKRRVSGKVKEEQSVSSVARISKRRRKREKQADVTGPPSVTADDDLNSLDEESVMGSQYDDFEENYTSSVDMPATKVISVTSEHSDIPLSLLELVDLWVRWLCVLSRRTFEVILWSHKSNDLIVSSLMGRKPSGGSHSKRPKTASEALRMKNWRNVSLKPDDIASVEKLLLWASKRNIVSKRRSVIEDRYTKSMEWIKIAEERLNGKNRVNIDKTVAFVKTGEKSLLFARPDLIQPLKEHIKKAKVWVSKLQRTSSDSVDMPMEVLDKMLPEADALALDLSEYIESVVEVTQVYCLCRQPHHGHMVACDSCDDWCHISCIGFTKAQAERADKFVCLRCNIHNSFKSAYATACKTVNTWMKPEDASRSLEIKRQKVLRKLNKDEKELIRLKADYSGVIAETTAHTAKAQKELDKIAAASAAAVSCALSGELGVNCKSSDVIASSNMNTVSDNQAAPISASVPVSVPCSTPSTANDVPRAPNSGICISSESNPSTETSTAMSAESTQKMGQATAEQALAPKCESIDGSAGLLFNTPSQPPIEELKRKERSLRYEINTVQSRVDRWRRENEEYTKFFALDLQCRFHFTEWMVAMQRILWPTTEDEKVGRPVEQGLPPGVEKRMEAAKLLGIDDLPEVKLILESFQWMAWCYRCLTTLRAPPTTKQLRKLIQDAKECRLSDDRIIKSLNGILSRSMSWKTKARKFLGMSGQSSSTPFTPRVLELSKAKQIFLEGNLNPIASRLKDMLRDCIEEASPSADDNRSGETGGKKSSAKSNAVDTHTISTPTALSISLKCRPPCSSDEDEPSSVEYTPTPSVYLAPRVDNIWPVNKDAPVEFKPYGPTYRHVFVNKEDHSVPTINTAVSGQVPFTAATNSSVEASISTSAPLAEKKRRRTSKPPSTQKAGRGFPYLPVHTTHKIITKDNTSSAPMVQAAFSTSTSSAAPQSGTNSTSVSGGSITSATVVGTSTAVASEGSKTSATVPTGPIASSLAAGGTSSTSNVPGATGASTGVAQEGSKTSATVPIGPIASSLAAGGTSSTSNVPGATGSSTGVAQEGSKTSATVPIRPIASSLTAGGTSSTSNVPGATGSSTGVAQEGSNTSATVPIGPIASSLAAGGTSSTSNVPGVTGASTGVAQEGSRAQTTESRGPITSSTSVVVGASTAVAQERVSASPTVPSGPIASLAVGGTTSTADTPGVTRTSTGVAPESTGAQATVPSGTMTSTLMTGATGIPSATVSGTSTTEQNNTIATTSAYEGADFEASVTSNTNPLCTGLTPYSANPDPTVASAPNMNSFSFVIPSSVDLNSNRQVHDNSRMEGPEIPSIGGDESEEPLSKRQRVDKGTHARNTAEPDGHPCDITRADS